jgi:hypothetical protein
MAGITAEQGQALLESGKGSDFTIECRGRVWNVHKLVLSTVSDHFSMLCTSPFKVSTCSQTFELEKFQLYT